jgi:hypothetical protein
LSARRKSRWSAKVKSAEAPRQERDRNASADCDNRHRSLGLREPIFVEDRSKRQTRPIHGGRYHHHGA